MNGPVSQALRQEIAEVVRARGLVVWLDKDGHYTAFVDDLVTRHQAGEFLHPVAPFRHSFLEQMLALEPYGSHLDLQPVLIHMPGHNEESIRKTPMLEYYEPGFRYRKALPTLVREVATGLVDPEAIERFVGEKDLSLEAADAWLARQTSAPATGLAARLGALDVGTLVEHLLGDGRLLESIEAMDDVDVLREHLRVQTGMDEAWYRFFEGASRKPGTGKPREHARAWVDALGGWLLCHEFVHDLTREPFDPSLRRLRSTPRPLLDRCLEAPKMLRKRHSDAYVMLADDVEGRIAAERDAVKPEELGSIDTFRFEEERILQGALAALARSDWRLAQTWSAERVGEDAFWVERDLFHRWEWKLVGDFARLGLALEGAGRLLSGARDLADAVDRYARTGYQVDTAHREFERSFHRPDVRLPDYDQLKQLHRKLRELYRAWADQLAEDFASLCEAAGPLPDSTLQQRTLYEQVVQPLVAEGGPVAVFFVDAFRFELAALLARELEGTGTTVRLDARLAELPTLTCVGMNVLPPVAQAGKLTPVLRSGELGGFRAGEFTVTTPEQRAKMVASRSGQVTSLKLADVARATTHTLRKKLGKTPGVILVHSVDIDSAGESGHLHDALDGVIQDVRSAWHQLQLAGVRRFVFTSDHGFLLQDETTAVHPYGKKTDPNRRHIVSEEPRNEAGMLTVPFAQLGYDGPPRYLLFRRDTAVFDNGHAGDSFVHGGNSLQERVIPVLVVTRKVAVGRTLSRYQVRAVKKDEALGYHRIAVQAELAMEANASLAFANAARLELGLRVPDRPDVRVVIRQPSSGAILADIGGDPVEVFFSLEGPRDEQVAVEVYHPAKLEEVEPATVTWFAVAGQSRPAPDAPDAGGKDWDDAINDEGFRRVFVHIHKHGSINEQEIAGLLGKARRVRAFAARFDELLGLVPFRVKIESVGSMKRYVKEGSS